jgi:hypothetical protein
VFLLQAAFLGEMEPLCITNKVRQLEEGILVGENGMIRALS